MGTDGSGEYSYYQTIWYKSDSSQFSGPIQLEIYPKILDIYLATLFCRGQIYIQNLRIYLQFLLRELKPRYQITMFNFGCTGCRTTVLNLEYVAGTIVCIVIFGPIRAQYGRILAHLSSAVQCLFRSSGMSLMSMVDSHPALWINNKCIDCNPAD